MIVRYAKAMSFHVVGLNINDTVLSEAAASGTDRTFNTLINSQYVQELKSLTSRRCPYAGRNTSEGAGNLGDRHLQWKISLQGKKVRVYRAEWEMAINFSLPHIIPKVETYSLEDINVMVPKMGSGKVSKLMAHHRETPKDVDTTKAHKNNGHEFNRSGTQTERRSHPRRGSRKELPLVTSTASQEPNNVVDFDAVSNLPPLAGFAFEDFSLTDVISNSVVNDTNKFDITYNPTLMETSFSGLEFEGQSEWALDAIGPLQQPTFD
ncbi:uncharacterized protein Z518_06095 [Rhinocladiella mackenziei CBS 650.93]|uniref:Uncharacterized protein n=1 Tax=Rhinocladiella mackenziei CBS 650.93 TaxID=1442369 RepID=A0A0D2H479_9EURO|nr:uncharacterized protein Z518_06095 [Rhinocladiella mackenziei CBS 650.93]KIX05223.1 hypothetical protein Z518_06095 [Rhinocladiella mackenziei CBS 650.93]